ncbi:hypothetical protein GOB40_13820 [Sinorhizobium meliloti]|nr:hypothetical protein [Sinorhizobium meliloti]
MTQYTIKAIPTTYNHVQFRSRLEARWAAFFDLCGWRWDYEPFDLDGWAPDFLIRTNVGPVLCEVKPNDIVTFMERQVERYENSEKTEPWPFADYGKAIRHSAHRAVCLLGDAPLSLVSCMPIGFFDKTPAGATFTFDNLHDALTPSIDTEAAWRQAGNVVQWNAATDHPAEDYHAQLRRVFKRSAA